MVKIGLGGLALLALIGVSGIGQEPAAPVRAGPKPYNPTAGASGFDVSQAYQGEEDDYEDDDYYAYAAGDAPAAPAMAHPGPGPGPVGGPPHPGGLGGWLRPDTHGRPGGPAGFWLNNRPFPLRRYHFTNDFWRLFGHPNFPRFFPGTPQLGFPYHPWTYPFITKPWQCHRFPFMFMPQCRRFRPQPWRWPWMNRPFNWGRGWPQHGQFPGRPGPWPRPGPGGHPGPVPGGGTPPGGHPGTGT